MKKTLIRLASPAPASRRKFGVRLGGSLALLAALAAVGLFASSRPAHTAGGPIPVNVANTVQTQNVDNPDQQPFQVTLIPYSGTLSSSTDSFTVPAGKRAVIDYYSAQLRGVPTGDTGAATLITTVNKVTAYYPLIVLQSTPVPANQVPRIYADPGSTVTVLAQQFGPSNSSGAAVVLSGHYVDVH